MAAETIPDLVDDMLRVLLALCAWDRHRVGAPRLIDVLADAHAVVDALTEQAG